MTGGEGVSGRPDDTPAVTIDESGTLWIDGQEAAAIAQVLHPHEMPLGQIVDAVSAALAAVGSGEQGGQRVPEGMTAERVRTVARCLTLWYPDGGFLAKKVEGWAAALGVSDTSPELTDEPCNMCGGTGDGRDDTGFQRPCVQCNGSGRVPVAPPWWSCGGGRDQSDDEEEGWEDALARLAERRGVPRDVEMIVTAFRRLRVSGGSSVSDQAPTAAEAMAMAQRAWLMIAGASEEDRLRWDSIAADFRLAAARLRLVSGGQVDGSEAQR